MVISGVYEWRNKLNGMVYIGGSVDIMRRLGSYIRREESSISPYLMEAFDKFGFENFSFTILDIIGVELDATEAVPKVIEREQHYLNKLNIDYSNKDDFESRTYNRSGSANSSTGVIFSEEKKAKIRELKKKRYGKGEINLSNKEVIQYDSDGFLVKKWRSQTDAAEAIGVDSSCVSKNANGKTRTCKGFIFRFKKDNPPEKLDVSKRILVYDLAMNLIGRYDSPFHIEKSIGFHHSAVTHLLNKNVRRGVGHKYIVMYEEV